MNTPSIRAIGAATLLVAVAGARATEPGHDARLCDAHAAAMVAEMKAAADEPLSDAELALVRRTAHKSCAAQAAAAVTDQDAEGEEAAVAATAATAAAAAGTATTKQGTWDSLLRLLDQDVEKTDGHKRLRRRSGTF